MHNPVPVRVELTWDAVAKVWVAEVRVGLDHPRLTQGRTAAEALGAARDVVRVMHDECADPTVSHCWCRPEARSGQDGRVCCRCNDWTAHRHRRGN